jgi:hypothetical protein
MSDISAEEQPPVTAPAAANTEAEERPSGPAVAIILAAGIASLCLGLLTTLAEANAGIADTLTFDTSVGPLSGKVIVSIITFFFFWGLLTALLWRRNPPLKTTAIASGVLVACGFLLTFPKFFELFAD